MTKPIIKHTYDSVASSLQESGANEAIHNVAYFNALLHPSLRTLVEQSITLQKVNQTIESFKKYIIIDCHSPKGLRNDAVGSLKKHIIMDLC